MINPYLEDLDALDDFHRSAGNSLRISVSDGDASGGGDTEIEELHKPHDSNISSDKAFTLDKVLEVTPSLSLDCKFSEGISYIPPLSFYSAPEKQLANARMEKKEGIIRSLFDAEGIPDWFNGKYLTHVVDGARV